MVKPEEFDHPTDTTDSARNRRLASHLNSHWNDLPIVLIERTSNSWVATLAADSTRSPIATTSTKSSAAQKKQTRKKPTRKKAAKKKPKPR